MKTRKFIYAGEPLPEITQEVFPAFFLQYQKAILAALQTRGLLTDFQYRRCIAEIGTQKNSERRPSHVDSTLRSTE